MSLENFFKFASLFLSYINLRIKNHIKIALDPNVLHNFHIILRKDGLFRFLTNYLGITILSIIIFQINSSTGHLLVRILPPSWTDHRLTFRNNWDRVILIYFLYLSLNVYVLVFTSVWNWSRSYWLRRLLKHWYNNRGLFFFFNFLVQINYLRWFIVIVRHIRLELLGFLFVFNLFLLVFFLRHNCINIISFSNLWFIVTLITSLRQNLIIFIIFKIFHKQLS